MMIDSHWYHKPTAVKAVKALLRRGADVTLRARWTSMNALHHAAFFSVAQVIDVYEKHDVLSLSVIVLHDQCVL